jgi:predicted HTH domain antitoxin
MNLTIPDELLEKNHLSSQMIKQEVSLFLLEKFQLTVEQATQIADISIPEFKRLLEKKTSAKKFNKLNNLKNRNCVEGDSEELVHSNWVGEWKPFI